MTLPPLGPDGTLPPGVHQIATLTDLFAAFPATTGRRQSLDSALIQFVDVVRRLALGTSIVIDGSYVTAKAEPEDVDVALLSTGAIEPDTMHRLQSEGVDLASLDLFVETTQSGFDGWVEFFSADREGRARGVVLITV